MPYDIKAVSQAVLRMDSYLRKKYAEEDTPKKLWENTYIYHQLEKRKAKGIFTVSDHIHAMVYSMLSSGMSWERVEAGIDIKTGKIFPIDELFHDYDPEYILSCDPKELRNIIKEEHHLATFSTKKQMEAIIVPNIRKLQELDRQYNGIDNYYQQFLTGDRPINNLVRQLSSPDSKDKLKQMGVPLTAEYLKNVGYDLGKPDRHICRILGSTALGCSDMKIVPVYDALDIVADIAAELDKPAAEVDYILWSYCAKGYGEICTKPTNKRKPQHEICVAKDICNYEE